MQMQGECSVARGDPRLGWGGARPDRWLVLLLAFQAPPAGMQAPGAGARKRFWQAGCCHLLTLRKDPCAPLTLPLRPRDGASAHWPVISLGPGFPGASISHPQMRQRSERRDGGLEGRKGRSEGLLLQPEGLRPPARAPRVAPDP